MKEISLKAYAKINLALDVLGILENGYHELDMIMQIIELHDVCHVSYEEGDAPLQIVLDSGREDLPVDRGNLAYRAAEAMNERFPHEGTVRISFEKNIPVAAGMAGGSADCGAVLHGLNAVWGLDLTLEELMDIGKTLGSDIPFSIMGMAAGNENLPEKVTKDPLAVTCARATYDGTRMTPVAPFDAYLAISKPSIGVSTKEVYQGIDAIEIKEHPDVEGMIAALEAKDYPFVVKNMVNVLELYTLNQYNCIMHTKDTMIQYEGAISTMMSGSGPTIFSVVGSKNEADELAEKMLSMNAESYSTRTLR